MTLSPGTRLGPYEILSALGAGGMGEVYRAHDAKLHRDVAIKTLLPAVANDPDRLARFSREAQLLASLNHPNIGAIYGFEESGGVRALVMELVEGPTLADRVAEGRVPVDEALPLAKQIAEALEAAHEQGIIHRDLKPANIKLRPDGTVKVLDFGLAKALDPIAASSANATMSPTLSLHATQAGLILGTAAYMSPEQARGKIVDKRTDVWAFGVVLFEMLTGARAFPGDDVTDTIVAVVSKEPDWEALPPVASGVLPLLRRCLKKDPKARMRDIGEARLQIDDLVSGVPEDRTVRSPLTPLTRRRVAAAIAALAGTALIAALVTWTVMRPPPQAPRLPTRFAIVPPTLGLSGTDRDLALSPDGRHVVYRAAGGQGGSPLIMRAMDSLDGLSLAGIVGARAPFFSPDSRWIAFFEGGQLKKASIAGGPAIALCRFGGLPRGASWGDDDTIIFATNDPTTGTSGLWQVAARGGAPTILTKPDAAQREGGHWFPSVLPENRGVLFTIAAPDQLEGARVAVLDLRTGQHTTLIRGASQAEYVETGHLVYAAAGALRAVRFDLATLRVSGDPVTVVEHVMMTSTGAANYAVSGLGTLVYVPGGVEGPPATPRSLVWVDRKGHETPIKATPRAYSAPRVSPDGTRVALEIHDQEHDLWVWDLGRETLTRLTAGSSFNGWPIWTFDSQRIIFASTRAGVLNLYGQAADGSGTVDRLTTSATNQLPTSITPDGTSVVGYAGDAGARDIVLFSLASSASQPRSGPPRAGAGGSEAVPLIHTPADESNAEVSPDGHYLAYQSIESRQSEIFVRPFPHVDGGRWLVSTAGGTRPAWSRSGRELFYLDGANTLTAVPVQTSAGTFSAGRPVRVFDTTYAYASPLATRSYDVSPDGQRFLMIKDSTTTGHENESATSLVFVLNWFEELKAKLSASK